MFIAKYCTDEQLGVQNASFASRIPVESDYRKPINCTHKIKTENCEKYLASTRVTHKTSYAMGIDTLPIS